MDMQERASWAPTGQATRFSSLVSLKQGQRSGKNSILCDANVTAPAMQVPPKLEPSPSA